MRIPHISSCPFALAILRVFLGLTLLGRSYLSHAAPTRAPTEYIETPASTEQLHQFLTDATLKLATNARRVYLAYKSKRLNLDSELDPRATFKVNGMPDVTELELPSTRLIHSEEDLLTTHQANLGIYYTAMEFVISDEAMYMGGESFIDKHSDEPTFMHIKDHITTTSQKINDLMMRKDFNNGVNRTPAVSGNLASSFRNQSDEHFRSLRDLCVLYEIYRYSNEVLHPDARMQATAHLNRESSASVR